MKRISIVILLLTLPVSTFSSEFNFEEAGIWYGVSPKLLEAIAIAESGKTINAISMNRNGSIDFCHMQVNAQVWGPVLKENWQYLEQPGYCTMVGAWILRQCMDRYGNTWGAVACYNTGYSPDDAPSRKKRQTGVKYISIVQRALKRLSENGG